LEEMLHFHPRKGGKKAFRGDKLAREWKGQQNLGTAKSLGLTEKRTRTKLTSAKQLNLVQVIRQGKRGLIERRKGALEKRHNIQTPNVRYLKPKGRRGERTRTEGGKRSLQCQNQKTDEATAKKNCTSKRDDRE